MPSFPIQENKETETHTRVYTRPKGATQMNKPGYKTTEFWMSTIAVICGIIMSSGAVHDGSMPERIIGGVMATLAALGYTAARAKTKIGE